MIDETTGMPELPECKAQQRKALVGMYPPKKLEG